MELFRPIVFLGTCAMLASNPVSAQRSSNIEPPEITDKTFVTDSGPGLDTGCTFRGGGPLQITAGVNRYVGTVDSNGYLRDVDVLIQNKVVTPKARIRMPAYDIDINGGSGSTAPEHDRVFFNGEDLGLLTGGNGIWKQNEFEVDIGKVKFPIRGEDGVLPVEAVNQIQINVDESNTSEEWCMSIDWVSISFDAMAPVLLVHGTDAQSDSWEPDFTNALDASRIPYSNDINLQANGSSNANAPLLKNRVNNIAKSFGAHAVHLIGHSKGGLDSRRFFSAHYSPNPQAGEPEVLSLTTITTPHHGTILSDLSVEHRTVNDLDSNDPDIEDFFDADAALSLAGKGPEGDALRQQTVANMAAFNRDNTFPAGIRFYTIGADADLNSDGEINADEATPLLPWGTRAKNGSIMYRILGNVQGYAITRHTSLGGLNEYHTLTPENTTTFRLNDLVVTEASAQHSRGTRILFDDANHSSVKDAGTLQIILRRLTSDFPLQ